VSAPPLKDELTFSPAPKLVGERNPDSVLFNIGELVPDEERSENPPARGKSEVVDPPANEEAPGPVARKIETDAQQKAASSGLISVHDLLHEETEAANAVPQEAVNPGLIPETPPSTPAIDPSTTPTPSSAAKPRAAVWVAVGAMLLVAVIVVATAL
jgi:hypothetical protein